jgi:hypothetical protein
VAAGRVAEVDAELAVARQLRGNPLDLSERIILRHRETAAMP